MKKLFKCFWITAMVVVIGFSATSCATGGTVAGTATPYGFFTGNGAAAVNTEGAEEIASYRVILGIVNPGYAEYDAAVKAAEASGKKVTSVTRWLLVMTETKAYAK